MRLAAPRGAGLEGRPVCRLISPGEVHDAACAEALLKGLQNGTVVTADKGYDA